jgi:hypothetical protein
MILFCCSRNNYVMLEKWISNNKIPENIKVLNFDVGSDNKNIQIGQTICKRHNIEFIVSNNAAIQACLEQAVNYAEKKLNEWVVYFQHDVYPLTTDFYTKLSIRLKNIGYNSSLGFVGVNVYHDKEDIIQFNGSKKWMTSARSFLQIGDGWYRRRKICRVNYNKFLYEDFLAESIMWVLAACHVKTFRKIIKVDNNYDFLLGFDDLLYQVVLNNCYNLVLSNLDLAHDQSLKEGSGIQKKSTIASLNQIKKNYGRIDRFEVWKRKFGFSFNLEKKFSNYISLLLYKIMRKLMISFMPKYYSGLNTIMRDEYKKNVNVKKSKLTDQFFNHDPANGPIKYFKDL